jgi:hypothetical protein
MLQAIYRQGLRLANAGEGEPIGLDDQVQDEANRADAWRVSVASPSARSFVVPFEAPFGVPVPAARGLVLAAC